MSAAWVYQDTHQVEKHGADKASWYVGWVDPEGKRRCKSCGPGEQGKRNAEKLRRKTEAELLSGTYRRQLKTEWADFRREFEEKIGAGQAAGTRRLTGDALNHFERIVKPVRVFFVNAAHIDAYVAARRGEPGHKRGTTVAEATINKELRHLRAVLRVAVDWGHLPHLPRFKMLREPGKLPRYVTGDHFAAMYGAADTATMPATIPNVTPGAWWRALLASAYLTGWRIGQLLALRREDVDLQAGSAVTWAEDNKGKRDTLVKLHPVVVEHFKAIAGFGPLVLSWPHDLRTLYVEFGRVQAAAGIHLPCRLEHEHTPTCHAYGFHDLRRAFATMNADKLTPDALQALMQHKSYLTTQKYINMARQMDAAVASLHVPEVLKRREAQ